MSKKKNKEFKNNHALPKTDVEFANNGLEKVALKAEENNKKQMGNTDKTVEQGLLCNPFFMDNKAEIF